MLEIAHRVIMESVGIGCEITIEIDNDVTVHVNHIIRDEVDVLNLRDHRVVISGAQDIVSVVSVWANDAIGDSSYPGHILIFTVFDLVVTN